MSDKKRKKNYYTQSGGGKRHKLNGLEVGMKGFLITCNNKEKGARRESYNLLNEYADIMYGPQKREGHESCEEDSDVDLEEAVKKEVEAIKATKSVEWRFKAVDSGANNCVFISTTIDDPVTLVYNILNDAYDTGVSKTRYILRILPVAGTCRADEEHMRKLAQEILPKFFEQKLGVSYKIEVKIRNNQVSRHVVISTIGKVVNDLNQSNNADLTNPDYVINVDILRTVCCIGVLKDFQKLKKYNIQEVSKIKNQLARAELNFVNFSQDLQSEKLKSKNGDELPVTVEEKESCSENKEVKEEG